MGDTGSAKGGSRIGGASLAREKGLPSVGLIDTRDSISKDGVKQVKIYTSDGKTYFIKPEEAKALLAHSKDNISGRGKGSVELLDKKGRSKGVLKLDRKQIVDIYNRTHGTNYKNYSDLTRNVRISKKQEGSVKFDRLKLISTESNLSKSGQARVSARIGEKIKEKQLGKKKNNTPKSKSRSDGKIG